MVAGEERGRASILVGRWRESMGVESKAIRLIGRIGGVWGMGVGVGVSVGMCSLLLISSTVRRESVEFFLSVLRSITR